MPVFSGKLCDAPCDPLPGANALGIARQRQGSDLLGDMERSVLAVGLQHPVGAGPQLPVGQKARLQGWAIIRGHGGLLQLCVD